MRIRGAARRAGVGTAAVLAVAVLAGAGATGDGRASSSTTVSQVRHAATRLAAAGASNPTPSFDAAVYSACAAAPPNNPHGPEPFEATVAGWSDANKLGEATAAGDPEPATIENTEPGEGFWFHDETVDGTEYFCQDATGELDYDGQREFPPVRATFLAFGTVPVTATAYLVQSGSQPLTAVSWADISAPGGTGSDADVGAVVTSRVVLRIADVTVNGTPLDVGDGCQTTGPLYSPASAADPNPADDPLLVMTGGDIAADGDPRPYYGNPQAGGALAGEAVIPPFTGCTTPDGENLDAMLDASISGPGNYLRFEQGPGCIEGTAYCVNAGDQPFPGALWTVTDGGSYTATSTAPFTFSKLGSAAQSVTISCPSSTFSGTIPDAAGPPRGAQDTPIQISFTAACTGTKTTTTGTTSYGTWTVTEEGVADPDFYFYDSGNGTVEETLQGVTLDLTGTRVPGTTAPCTIQVIAHLSANYADATAELSSNSSGLPSQMIVASTTCPTPPAANSTTPVSFDYQFSRHIQITSP